MAKATMRPGQGLRLLRVETPECPDVRLHTRDYPTGPRVSVRGPAQVVDQTTTHRTEGTYIVSLPSAERRDSDAPARGALGLFRPRGVPSKKPGPEYLEPVRVDIYVEDSCLELHNSAHSQVRKTAADLASAARETLTR